MASLDRMILQEIQGFLKTHYVADVRSVVLKQELYSAFVVHWLTKQQADEATNGGDYTSPPSVRDFFKTLPSAMAFIFPGATITRPSAKGTFGYRGLRLDPTKANEMNRFHRPEPVKADLTKASFDWEDY